MTLKRRLEKIKGNVRRLLDDNYQEGLIFTVTPAVRIGPFYISKFYFKIGYQERLLFTVKYKRVIYRILFHQDKYFLMVKF